VLPYFLLRERLCSLPGWIWTSAPGWSLAWLGSSWYDNPLGSVTLPASQWTTLAAGLLIVLLLKQDSIETVRQIIIPLCYNLLTQILRILKELILCCKNPSTAARC
jgi:hypothetical protein